MNLCLKNNVSATQSWNKCSPNRSIMKTFLGQSEMKWLFCTPVKQIRQSCVSTEKEWWRYNPHHTGENYNCSDVKSSETQSRSHRCKNQCFMISRTRIRHIPFRIFHSSPMFCWGPVGPKDTSVFGLKPGPVFPTKDTERPKLLPLIIELHNHVVLIRWCIMRHPWRQCGPWWQLCVWQRRHWWRRLC